MCEVERIYLRYKTKVKDVTNLILESFVKLVCALKNYSFSHHFHYFHDKYNNVGSRIAVVYNKWCLFDDGLICISIMVKFFT